MELKKIEDDLYKIYNLRNIESISMIDMVLNSSNMIVPGFVVMYDGGKYIAYYAIEKYFNEFVRKLTEVYNDEKNNILEESITNPFIKPHGINIDDKSKKVLENGILPQINKLYNFYNHKQSFNNRLLFQKSEVKANLNIVLYHINKLLDILSKDITFIGNIDGYRDNYIIEATNEGIIRTYPFAFEEINENTYLYEFGDIFSSDESLKVTINYNHDGILIRCEADNLNIYSEAQYKVCNGVVKYIYEVKHNNLPVVYENKDLAPSEMVRKNLVNIDSETNLHWFSLPWNAYIGINTSIEEISDTEKLVDIHNMYLCEYDNDFLLRDIYSRKYHRLQSDRLKFSSIILDSFNKKIIGILNKDIGYLLETSFLDSGNSSSHYEDKLENRFFYHGANCYELSDLEREKLISLGNKEAIFKNTDLINVNKITKILRRQ